ncbi:MAG: hypothetical protein ACREFR_00570 [Limisphaerales bacterium]
MNAELVKFAARIERVMSHPDCGFNELALELYGLQFKYNPAYRLICEAKQLRPDKVRHWYEAPFAHASTFKELELSCIDPEERTSVFHSSGTTEQKPSRHFHSWDSLKLYEGSLWAGFAENLFRNNAGRTSCMPFRESSSHQLTGTDGKYDLLILTPSPGAVPHSSLVHMFETVRRHLAAPETVFVAKLGGANAWVIDFKAALAALRIGDEPKLILGTAFSFVHLLDSLAESSVRLQLPIGSRVMETGGYKNRSRAMPKTELHSLIMEYLGIPHENIICEYGMSELGSQAYDTGNPERYFHFPAWTGVQIVSPETGFEVSEGETGLVRIFDLANVFSVAAIQTEDLAIRRGCGFELIGRAALAEVRGCSVMTV